MFKYYTVALLAATAFAGTCEEDLPLICAANKAEGVTPNDIVAAQCLLSEVEGALEGSCLAWTTAWTSSQPGEDGAEAEMTAEVRTQF